MKAKLAYSTLAGIIAASAAFAASETLEGGATAGSAVAIPNSYDKSTQLTLTAPAAAEGSYFTSDGNTIGTLTVTGDVNYYISGDINLYSSSTSNSNILTLNGATDTTLTFSNGTINIGESTHDINTMTFKIPVFVGSSLTSKAIIFDSYTTTNLYASKLILLGYYATHQGGSRAFEIRGDFSIYTPNSETYGDLEVSWNTMKIDDKTRGARTGLYINGGTLNAKDVTIKNYSKLDIQNGGDLNASSVTLYGNNTDQSPQFTIGAGSSALMENLTMRVGYNSSVQQGVNTNVYGNLTVSDTFQFTFQDESHSSGATAALTVYSGGTATIDTADLTKYGKIDNRGALALTTANIAGGAQLITSGGTTNIDALTMTGGALSITNGGTVNLNGDSSISGGTLTMTNGSLTVKNGGSLDYGFSTIATGGSSFSFNVEKGASFAANSALTVSGGGSFNMAGTASAETLTLTGSTANIDGTLNLTKTGDSNFYAISMNAGARLVIGEDGSVIANANARVEHYGTIEINSGEHSFGVKEFVTWQRNNELILNGSNQLYNPAGGRVSLNIPNSSCAKITVRGTAEFGQVNFQSNVESPTSLVALYLTMDFANSSDYVLLKYINVTGEYGRIYATNFENYRLKVGQQNAKLALFDGDENPIDFEYVEDGSGFYWVNAVPVPEPAEWAAMLGAVCLAFAAWRRRK